MNNSLIKETTNLIVKELEDIQRRVDSNLITQSESRGERTKVFDKLQHGFLRGGIESWEFYANFISNSSVAPQFRAYAVNRIHGPELVPIGPAAYSIGSAVIYAMLDGTANDFLKSQAFMATGILRDNYPATAMIPINTSIIDKVVMPYIGEMQKSSSDVLNHILHTMPTVAKFVAIHPGKYESVLRMQAEDIQLIYYKAVAEMQGSERLGLYGYIHPLEHLADVFQIAADTKSPGVLEVIKDKDLVGYFNEINLNRIQKKIPDTRDQVPRYIEQRDHFLFKASQSI